MNEQELKQRTRVFANWVADFTETLPQTRQGARYADQLFRAGTSVGANYRAACRGRSKAEFISKLGIALEEADETLYWLELITDRKVAPVDRTEPLKREADELVSILVASINTARGG